MVLRKIFVILSIHLIKGLLDGKGCSPGRDCINSVDQGAEVKTARDVRLVGIVQVYLKDTGLNVSFSWHVCHDNNCLGAMTGSMN